MAKESGRKSSRIDRSRKRRFERSADNTFWEIKLGAITQTVWSGAIGSRPPARVKTYGSKMAAEKAYDKLVSQRVSEGYKEVDVLTRRSDATAGKATKRSRSAKKAPSRWEHEVFGQLERVKGVDALWERQISMKVFGKVQPLQLLVEGSFDKGFHKLQIESYRRFMRRKASLFRVVEGALFKHYRDICSELREQFDDCADELAPVAKSIGDFSRIVQFQTLFLRAGRSARSVAVLADCTWDTSHGVGVLLVEERVTRVGSQDLVL